MSDPNKDVERMWIVEAADAHETLTPDGWVKAVASVSTTTIAAPEAGPTTAATDTAETCDMRHQEPYDFAHCETHDTTFALGEKCKFEGRVMWEVYADEADRQRGRAVTAEMQRDRALDLLALYVDDEPCRFEDGRCHQHGPHAGLPAGMCAMVLTRALLEPPTTGAQA